MRLFNQRDVPKIFVDAMPILDCRRQLRQQETRKQSLVFGGLQVFHFNDDVHIKEPFKIRRPLTVEQRALGTLGEV